MKTLISIILVFIKFNLAAQNIAAGKRDLSIGDTIQGDFNGDGKPEYLWVVNARDNVKYECIDKQCKITAHCSNKKIPTLVTKTDYDSGILYNEGDLNNDGADDVSFVIWGDGSWSGCYVYTLHNNKWVELVNSFSLWDGLGQENIKIDPNNPGNIIIKEWHGGDSIWVETRSEPVNYYKKKK
jgi:hypothetical protein